METDDPPLEEAAILAAGAVRVRKAAFLPEWHEFGTRQVESHVILAG